MWLYTLSTHLNIFTIIPEGTNTARSIAASWDQRWLDLLQNNTENNLYTLYAALTTLGTFFAVGTLLFFMIQWLRDLIDSEYSRPIAALIWPFIVVVLLANLGNGTVLSNLTLGVRNYLNYINQEVVRADNSYSYQQALSMSVAEEVAGSFLRPCQSLIGQQQIDCLTKAKEEIVTLLGEYRNSYGPHTWIDRLETKVNQIADPNGNDSEVTEFAFNSLLGSTVQTSIKNILISLQSAFQNLIEVLMLLIAALGPLAVGGSLLPVAGKPIYAWLTGLISMGIAKISFNIIAVLTSAMIVYGPANIPDTELDLMWFLILLGILGPIFSLVIAIAGGFAVFNAISNTAVWVRERV